MAGTDIEQHRAFAGVVDILNVDFFVPRHDPIIEWAFKHKRALPFDEVREAWYMPPESVIVTKLRTFRDSGSTRHLDDVEGIPDKTEASWAKAGGLTA
jgi:hypothetical protein